MDIRMEERLNIFCWLNIILWLSGFKGLSWFKMQLQMCSVEIELKTWMFQLHYWSVCKCNHCDQLNGGILDLTTDRMQPLRSLMLFHTKRKRYDKTICFWALFSRERLRFLLGVSYDWHRAERNFIQFDNFQLCGICSLFCSGRNSRIWLLLKAEKEQPKVC